MIDSCLAGRRPPWGQMRNMPQEQASPIRRLQSPNNGGERPQTMKALPVIVLVTLIPVATFASTASIGNGIGQGQIPANTSEAMIGSPDLARCQGAKCAGPGDRIRNGQDIDGRHPLADNRGGQTTSGTKKGSRHYDDQPAAPVMADNRGGQTTSGTKKGSRHYDDQPATPVLAGNRGGQSSSGTRKGSRHHDDEIGNPVRLS